MIPYENWGHIGASSPSPRPTAKERRAGIAWLLVIAAVFLALAFGATGCATTHPIDSRLNAELQAPPVGVDSAAFYGKDASLRSSEMPISGLDFGSKTALNAQKKPIIDASLRPALLPRLTDAIGLSTREGRAHRQAVKLAKAAAPHVGKGGVLAINSNVSNGFKSTAAVVTADTGAVVSTNGDNSQQQAVKGDDNRLDAKKQDTTQEAPGFWATFAKPLGYFACAVGIVGVGYLLYLIWGFLPRRKDNAA